MLLLLLCLQLVAEGVWIVGGVGEELSEAIWEDVKQREAAAAVGVEIVGGAGELPEAMKMRRRRKEKQRELPQKSPPASRYNSVDWSQCWTEMKMLTQQEGGHQMESDPVMCLSLIEVGVHCWVMGVGARWVAGAGFPMTPMLDSLDKACPVWA